MIHQASTDKVGRSLVDTGSGGRYLLYAVGEITLVVIGILIALQINNWNENKKHILRQVGMLNSLILDLNDKMEENINDLEFGESMLVNADKAINSIRSGNDVDTADIKDLIGHLGSDTWFYNIATPTFNSIVNSELWQELPDTLAKEIQTIYDHSSTRVSLGFEKLTDYATDCRLNYLTPNGLMDPAKSPTALNEIIAKDRKSFEFRLILFINGLNRQNRYFSRSKEAIKELMPRLISYRDELAKE